MVRSAEARGTGEVALSGDRRGGELQLSALFPHSCWGPPKLDVPRSKRGDLVEAKILRLHGVEEPDGRVDANLPIVEVRGGNDFVAYNPHRFVRQFRLQQGAVT